MKRITVLDKDEKTELMRISLCVYVKNSLNEQALFNYVEKLINKSITLMEEKK